MTPPDPPPHPACSETSLLYILPASEVAIRKVLQLLWGIVPFLLYQTQNIPSQVM